MKTTVAVFEDAAAADQAADALANAGITRDRIHLESGDAARVKKPSFLERLFGIHKEDADLYAEGVRRGHIVLAVDCGDDEIDLVEGTLSRFGPIDIDRRAQAWRAHGWTGYDASAPHLTDAEVEEDRRRTRDAEARIPVAEEQLKVGKQAVRTGGVHVRSYVEEVPVSADVDLKTERVSVEKRRTGLSADTGNVFEEKEIDVEEYAEQPLVQKEAVVSEEVVVKKDVDVRKETVKDTVRKTRVEIDDEAKRNPSGR